MPRGSSVTTLLWFLKGVLRVSPCQQPWPSLAQPSASRALLTHTHPLGLLPQMGLAPVALETTLE